MTQTLSIYYAMYSIQAQYFMHCMPCTAFLAQRCIHSVPCTALYAQHAVRSIQCTAYSAQDADLAMVVAFQVGLFSC